MPILSTLLELFPVGVLIVKKSGKIVSGNNLATEILEANTEIMAHKGVISAPVAEHARILKAALELASLNPAASPVGFSISRAGRRPLSIAVSPTRKLNYRPLSPNIERRVLILLSDPEIHFSAGVDFIAKMFELTLAEAAVAKRMIAGEDVAEIASTLGISPNTVRNHLKRLFLKTNTTKHCDLLHTLMRSPAGLQFLPLDTLVRNTSGTVSRFERKASTSQGRREFGPP